MKWIIKVLMRCHITVYLCIGLSPQWKWKLTTWAQTFSSCIFVNWYSRDASIIWCLIFYSFFPLKNSSYLMTSNFKIILNIHKYFATACSEGNLAHIVSKQTSRMWTLKNCLNIGKFSRNYIPLQATNLYYFRLVV